MPSQDASSIIDMIRNGRFAFSFLPIVSVKQKSVIGLESACEGLDAAGGRLSLPDIYRQAAAEGSTLALDRHLREIALAEFQAAQAQHPEFLLFLNFDAAVVDLGVVGSGLLRDLVSKLQLNVNNIVIKIRHSDARDFDALKAFIDRYRKEGFLIALDDVGSGHSNLHRITLTRPDMLKLDATLVQGLDGEFYKREILKSLINFSRNLGILMVADGVMREEEAFAALELGADMLQGPYFAGLSNGPAADQEKTEAAVRRLADTYKTHLVEKRKNR